MRVEFLSSAQVERLAAAEYLELRRGGIGVRFSDEVKVATKRISSDAESFAAEPDALPGEDLRSIRLKSFAYRLVFTLVGRDLAIIVAVVHDAQRPRYWRSRV